jgi:hypothetical protein
MTDPEKQPTDGIVDPKKGVALTDAEETGDGDAAADGVSEQGTDAENTPEETPPAW